MGSSLNDDNGRYLWPPTTTLLPNAQAPCAPQRGARLRMNSFFTVSSIQRPSMSQNIRVSPLNLNHGGDRRPRTSDRRMKGAFASDHNTAGIRSGRELRKRLKRAPPCYYFGDACLAQTIELSIAPTKCHHTPSFHPHAQHHQGEQARQIGYPFRFISIDTSMTSHLEVFPALSPPRPPAMLLAIVRVSIRTASYPQPCPVIHDRPSASPVWSCATRPCLELRERSSVPCRP